MRDRLKPLFTPFALGSLTLPNRFVMSPMTRNFSPGGVPGEGVAAYYRRRAEAGMGLIITEGVAPDHPAAVGDGTTTGSAIPHMFGDAALAAWREVVDAVHSAGGKIAPQLWHMGPVRVPGTGPFAEAPSVRPSGIWGPLEDAVLPPAYRDAVGPATSAATDSEIADTIAGFARAAANAVAVGFDAIALHGAHGYLIDSFLWAETNRRTDRWGGNAAERTRYALAVIEAVRREMPRNMPLILRISQWKIQDYAATLATSPGELETILAPLAAAGVDLFDVSTRRFDAPAFAGSDMGLAGWARKLTGKPVMTVGGVGFDKDLQSSFVEETHAKDNLDEVARRFDASEFDLVAVGRAVLMDSDWINKVRRSEPFGAFNLAAYGSLV